MISAPDIQYGLIALAGIFSFFYACWDSKYRSSLSLTVLFLMVSIGLFVFAYGLYFLLDGIIGTAGSR